jgi:hypothetical protein
MPLDISEPLLFLDQEHCRGQKCMSASAHPRDENITSQVRPVCSVSKITDVAGMGLRRVDSVKTRSATKLVSLVLNKINCKIDISTPGPWFQIHKRWYRNKNSVRLILESLIWPFVARRSLRSEWFSRKELDRLIASFSKTGETIKKYVSDDNKEQVFCKYWLDRYLCQVFGDPSFPQREDWITDQLFSGWCRIFIRRAIKKRDCAFIYSLQKGSKKLWPKLGEEKERQALIKHANRVSEIKGKIPRAFFQSISSLSRRILGKITRNDLTKFLPTGSACLQASRRKGGALSLVDPFQPGDLSGDPTSKKLGRLRTLNARLDLWRSTSYSKMMKNLDNDIVKGEEKRELIERLVREGEYDEHQRDYVTGNVLPNLVVDEMGYSHSITGARSDHIFNVNVVTIPEPSKFRIITKGDGNLYSVLQPIQGAMLSAWKRRPESTMRFQDLTEKVQKMEDECSFLPFFCSVDYESATDLLFKDASLAAFSGLDPTLPNFDLARASLIHGWASYYNEDIDISDLVDWPVKMEESQLMGGPLSFVLLCITNLAVRKIVCARYLRTSPPLEREYRRKVVVAINRNTIVNGDDMLFKCDKALYDIFNELTKLVGFKPSQGKNYLSRDCCMINSQVFRRLPNGKMKKYGYLNLKLTHGSSVKLGESLATPEQVGSELSRMMDLCPWTRCVIPHAFSRWGNDWNWGPIRPNWYVPLHLGGFGIDRKHAPPDFKVTRQQRRIASQFVADPRISLYKKYEIGFSTADFVGSVLKWRYDLSTNVPEKYQVEDSDPWLERLAYISRASADQINSSNERYANHFELNWKLKPMSHDTLDKYWNARMISSGSPACPPLNLPPIVHLSKESEILIKFKYNIRSFPFYVELSKRKLAQNTSQTPFVGPIDDVEPELEHETNWVLD